MSEKKVVEVEATDKKVDAPVEASGEAPKTEKKDGFFSKLKKSMSDATRESRIEGAFNEGSKKVDTYKGTGLLNQVAIYGRFNEAKNEFTVYGEYELKEATIIKNGDELYHVVGVRKDDSTKLDINVKEDGVVNVYNRQCSVLLLDSNVTKVDVIKVGDIFVLKK